MKKNILIITTIFPYPLNSGGAQAQFNMVDELRKHHNIFMLFTQDRNNRLEYMNQLKQLWPEVTFIPYLYVWQMCNPVFLYNKIKRGLQTYLTPNDKSFLVDRAIRSICILQNRKLETFINKTIAENKIDVVQIEFFPAINLVRCLPDTVKKIFIQHEIHYVKNDRFFEGMSLTEKQKQSLRESQQFEIDAMNQYDTVVTLTDADKQQLQKDGVTTTIYVSPAAIDAKTYPYEEWNGKLSFVGASNHLPNQDGVEWMLKDVAKHLKRDTVRLDVIGKGWKNLSSPYNLDVKCTGFVSDLYSAIGGTIMVVPILSGSGMRMKILEAAAASVPFVTTSVGVEGLDFKNGDSCFVADSAEDFADAIQQMIDNPELRAKLANNALEVYLNNYTTKMLAKKRNEIYIQE